MSTEALKGRLPGQQMVDATPEGIGNGVHPAYDAPEFNTVRESGIVMLRRANDEEMEKWRRSREAARQQSEKEDAEREAEIRRARELLEEARKRKQAEE